MSQSGWKSGAAPQRGQALFSYAVYSFFSGMLPILLAFCLEFFLGCYTEACLSALWCVKIFLSTRTVVLLPSLVSLAMLSLWILSPINNDARKLSERERHAFRRIARILSVIALATYLTMQITTLKSHSVPVGVGIVLVAVLQLPCIPRRLALVLNHRAR